MSFEDFKIITTDNPGSILRYGGNDLKELMRMLNGELLINRKPKIATQWQWLNNTLSIMNPANTFSYTFETSAITANRKIILPDLASDATLVLNTAANTFTLQQIFNATLTVNKTAQSGVAELLQQWTVADSAAGSKVEIVNASITDAVFAPWIRVYNLDNSTDPALYIYGYIGNLLDSGTQAAMRLDVRKADNSAITTRPLFSFRNAGTEVFAIGQTTVAFGNRQIVNATAGSTLTGIVDANISTHTTTKITTTAKGQLNTAIVYTDQANTFGAFDQKYLTSRLMIRNPADTFSYIIAGSAITTADKTITLPLLTGNDTAVTEAHAQTLTNKTIAAGSNTISGIVDAQIGAHTSTKITITNKAQLPAAAAYEDEANTYSDFDQIFRSSRLIVRNSANTFSYIFATSAITANRTITIPLLTSDGNIAVDSFANIFTASQEVSTTSTAELLKLYRPESLLTDIDISYYWRDSLGNKTRYTVLRSTPTNVTDGQEASRFDIFLLTNGVFVRNLRLNNIGDLAILVTPTTGYTFSGTGLTGTRSFTWPDLSGKVITDNFGNVFTATQAINKTSQAGVAETLHEWKVGDDTSSYLRIENAISTDAIFAPLIRAYNNSASTLGALHLFGRINTGHDSGSAPVIWLDARTNSDTAIATRPLFDVRNLGTVIFRINPTSFDFTGKRLDNTRGVAELPVPSNNDSRRFGTVDSPICVGVGAFAAVGIVTHGTHSVSGHGTEGNRTWLRTTTTINTNAGWRTGSGISFTRRGYNPKWTTKFELVTTTNQTFYFGPNANDTPPAGNDPVNGVSGFLFGMNPSLHATNWIIVHNRAGGGVSKVIDTGVAFGIGITTVVIEADNTLGWRYQINNGTFSSWFSTSTDFPNAGDTLRAHFNIQNTAAEEKQVYHYITGFQSQK